MLIDKIRKNIGINYPSSKSVGRSTDSVDQNISCLAATSISIVVPHAEGSSEAPRISVAVALAILSIVEGVRRA